MDPEEIVRQARDAIARGADPQAVLEYTQAKFGALPARAVELGFEASDDAQVSNLVQAARFSIEADEAANPAQMRMSAEGAQSTTVDRPRARPGAPELPTPAQQGAVKDLATTTIPGLAQFGGELFGGDFDQRVADVRSENPTLSKVATGVGGAMIPGGAGLRAGGFFRGAGRAALAGGAEGGILGFGEAEGSVTDRLASPEVGMGAGIGFLSGGALGGLAGPAGRMLRNKATGQAGPRLATGMAEASGDIGPSSSLGGLGRRMVGGRSARDIVPVDARAAQFEDNIEMVRREFFPPLDEIAPSTRILESVEDLRAHEEVGDVVREALNKAGAADQVTKFDQPQEVARALRREADRLRNAPGSGAPAARVDRIVREFEDQMEESFPGFKEANRQLRKANEQFEAYQIGGTGKPTVGRTSIKSSLAGVTNDDLTKPARVRLALKQFEDPESQAALKQGLRDRIIEDFLTMNDRPSPIAQRFAAMEPGTRDEVMEVIFDDTQAKKAFNATLEQVMRDSPDDLGGFKGSFLRSMIFRRLP